jgi:hypothetical protein
LIVVNSLLTLFVELAHKSAINLATKSSLDIYWIVLILADFFYPVRWYKNTHNYPRFKSQLIENKTLRLFKTLTSILFVLGMPCLVSEINSFQYFFFVWFSLFFCHLQFTTFFVNCRLFVTLLLNWIIDDAKWQLQNGAWLHFIYSAKTSF